MKRTIAILLATALLLTLVACGSGSESAQTPTEQSSPEKAVESVADPKELVGSWINLETGEGLEINAGTPDSDSNAVKGSTEYTPVDRTLSSWSNGANYQIEGDLFTLGDEQFQIVREDEKLYLKGQDTDTTYIRRTDFYRFEDLEVHQMGDTVSTDAVEFTLNGYGYADQVDPVSLGGNVAVFQKEPLVPDSGMIWAKMSYQLVNVSNQTISLNCTDNNVRFFVVYKDSFTFDMESYNWNYITKGYGGDSHVEWLGSHSNQLELPSLVSEDFATWLPVAPAVKEDLDSPLHLIVLLPKVSGTKIFAYDLRSAGQSGTENGLYGTWRVTEVNTGSGATTTVAELESNKVYGWSDWKIIVSEAGKLYLQTNNNSITGDAQLDDGGITMGKNRWDYKDGKLVLDSGNAVIYYEKESDNQSFPDLKKNDLIGLLKGTWIITGSRTGSITFTEKTASAEINGTALFSDAAIDVIMDDNRINLSDTSSGVMVSIDLDYTYENGALSLVYSGDTLVKQ